LISSLISNQIFQSLTCLSPWMNLLMQTLQPLTGDMGIDLGG
jgi:hypothetical protein